MNKNVMRGNSEADELASHSEVHIHQGTEE